MATKLSFLEKIANITGVLYRHQAKQFPRRLDILTKVAKRELAPPKTTDWPLIKKEFNAVVKFIETKQYNNLSVRVSLLELSYFEALVYAGVGLEIIFWFFIGEIIGRRYIVGYLVPSDYVSKDTKKQVAAIEAEKI
uniref:ATP synthase subunit g, mitochondrial n=1 Tax=Panagrellus redivivus TaxID=6233 RepID=A0A7E4UNW2_PANRE